MYHICDHVEDQFQEDGKYLGVSRDLRYIYGQPSKSVSPLWDSYDPAAQIEIEGTLRRFYPEPLTKWYNPQGSETAARSSNPTPTGD